MYSDLLLLQWMVANNIPFDLYQDGDLHVNSAWLSHYKGLVLGSHPEYWTETMRTNVLNYSTAGG
jgi:N,N-dimethylformamidase